MTSTFYPPYHIGGDAVHVEYLAEELARRGHEVHVLYSRDAYRLKRKNEPGKIDNGKVHVHALESPYGRLTPMKVYAFGNSNFILGNYRKLISDVKPDVVHHHNISLLGHGIFKKIGNYRQFYTAHDYWLICQRNDLTRHGKPCDGNGCKACAISSRRPPQFWRLKLDLDGIDFIIAPSRYMAEKLEKLHKPIEVLPNFTPPPPEKIADADNPGYFLYLGVLEPHKGIHELVEGFKKSNHRLIIAGKGSLSHYVEHEIAQNKLGPRIKYTGWIEDKWPAMKGACAMILPSIWPENSPLSVLEAMSVGTPTFCTDLGGTREIVERIYHDMVLPADSLAERLATIEPPKLDRKLVRGVWDAHYTPEKYIDRYLSLSGGGLQST
jgi:glycosyltransferase involved in cell wall biosynthesis